MIRFFIKNGNNSVKFDAPTDELFDHLGSIGIGEDIPITCSEKIYLDFYPTDNNDEIAKIVCDRLLPEDKISDVNRLCDSLTGFGELPLRNLRTRFRKTMCAAR